METKTSLCSKHFSQRSAAPIPGVGICTRTVSWISVFPNFYNEYIHSHIYLQVTYYTLKKEGFFPFLVHFSLIIILWLGMAMHICDSRTKMAKAERLHIGGKSGLHSTSWLEKKRKIYYFLINHVPELICPITFLVSLGIVQLLPRHTFIHSFLLAVWIVFLITLFTTESSDQMLDIIILIWKVINYSMGKSNSARHLKSSVDQIKP